MTCRQSWHVEHIQLPSFGSGSAPLVIVQMMKLQAPPSATQKAVSIYKSCWRYHWRKFQWRRFRKSWQETVFLPLPARWGSLGCIRVPCLLLLPPPSSFQLQISMGSAKPQLRAPDLSGHCRTSTASSRSVGAARPQPWAPDLSGHCRSSTASSRSVGTARPQPWAPDLSGQCPCQRDCQNRFQIECQNRMPDKCQDRMSEKNVRIDAR